MHLIKLRRIPFILLTFIATLLTACTPKSEAPPVASDEAKQIAERFLAERFLVRETRWLALEGTPPRLVELNKPTTSLYSNPVTETDRMNGVQNRRTLAVDCAQFRHWRNGTWTEWQAGGGAQTGVGAAVVHSMTRGALTRYTYQLEKKNGQWSVRDMKANPLSTDRRQLEQAIKIALPEIQ